jgi:hypothetical protein
MVHLSFLLEGLWLRDESEQSQQRVGASVSTIAVALCGVTSAVGSAVAPCGGVSWVAASTSTASPAP